MITITHTHENGTILTGSTKGDGVYEIVKAHGFTFRPTPGIHIRGSRDKDAREWRINAAAEALRGAGHDVTIEIDNTWRPAAQREAERAERVEARVERLEERASKAAGRSAAARAAYDHIADGIPFGQPKMPDHHSYGRACRDEERMHTLTRRRIAEADYADQLADRANGAERNEAAKHNPRAIMRRIETLQVEARDIARKLEGYSRQFRNGRGEVIDTEVHEPASGEWADRLRRRGENIAEEIAHHRSKLAALEEAGTFVAWGPDHFVKGDHAQVSGRWYPVKRVNTKSVSLDGASWPYKATWDDIHGRRRDGLQIDSPNGQPWPVADAVRVARWRELLHRASLPSSRYSDEERHVGYAQRIAHGLPIGASDAEVKAFPPPASVEDQRAHALAYLAVYERLAAGELIPDVAATVEPIADTAPAWRLPQGPTVDRRVDQLVPGDVVKGFYDRGLGTSLVRSFCGPVKSVGAVVDRREKGMFRTVTLASSPGDESMRNFETHVWFAVHPASAAGRQAVAPDATTDTGAHEAAAIEEASAAVDWARGARRDAVHTCDPATIDTAGEALNRANEELNRTLRAVPDLAAILDQAEPAIHDEQDPWGDLLDEIEASLAAAR